MSEQNLPACRLCGKQPDYYSYDNVCCVNVECRLFGINLRIPKWIKLMSAPTAGGSCENKCDGCKWQHDPLNMFAQCDDCIRRRSEKDNYQAKES